MAGISHPVIGDAEHGDSKANRRFQQCLGVTRLMLAAVRLDFVHPFSAEPITIESAPDESFNDTIERLRTQPA
jgi:tRNA pseudouridine65 synthase